MWFRKKRSVCLTCPEREASCLAGHCSLRYCSLCIWSVNIGALKAFFSAKDKWMCGFPKFSNPVTGEPTSSCNSCRSYSHMCDREGRHFKHKDMCPSGVTAGAQG